MNPNYKQGCTAFLRSSLSCHINRLKSIFPLELQQRSCKLVALQSSLMAEHLNPLDVGSLDPSAEPVSFVKCKPVFSVLNKMPDVKIGTFNQILAVLIVRID